MVEDLIAQQKKVKSGLKAVKEEVAGMPDVVNKINDSLMQHAEASKKQIAGVQEEVDEVEEGIAALRQTVKR